MSDRLPSDSQISHYRILSKIGEGGMGEVWLAEDSRLGRKVALKLLPAEFTEDSERVRRFTQEAKAASALNHPNIIAVYDIGESDTGRFIVMEFVAGRTLRTVIAKDNSLETFFTLGAQMARGLSAAHAAGITHRDIKPDNIMVRDDGYVKMLDFGLARLLPTTSSDPEAMTLAQQTTPGTVMGTLAYMSPEQASGQTVGSPSDVFALGIVLYELATGSHPFKSETMIGYLHAITSQTPPSMTSLKSHLPPALDDLILRMLDKDASKRPMASEVAQALQEIEKYGSSKAFPFSIAGDKPKARSEEEGFWVAVLPFKYRGANSDIEALAEGLSEDILTGLSRFSYLRVIARGSTLRYANQTTDLRNVGTELGARYVMEGTLRHAGTKLRLAVQLVDATTGAHLWVENYEREFSPENIFELQDDLVPRIVSTVADWYGALPHSMSERVRLKAPEQLSPYEALLRSFGYFENIVPGEHAIVRSSLKRAVEQEPGNADLWAMLSMMFGEEHRFGFNVEPDSLGRSLDAARKAVEIAHANHFAWLALAQALFFRKEFDPFRDAAERAITLNPMDGSTVEYLGHLIAFSGNWERGCELAERARQLNPNHPSWYWAVFFLDAYRKGDYVSAHQFLMRGNPQKNYLMHALLAAGNAQLGESEMAARHLREMLTMMPDFPSIGRDEFSKWYPPELVDHLMDGIRKAGLKTDVKEIRSALPSESNPSHLSRTDEGFWVAVLPFKANSTSQEVTMLADGLSEEIVTGLSRFSYLRVIARSSTMRYSGQDSDVRSVGKELGARYVMEGTLRQAGTKLRLAVQLVDAETGAHLWAENYERTFSPEAVFELQDDLVPLIVSSVADAHGVLPHIVSESLRSRDVNSLTAYEAVMRSFAYGYRFTADELALCRAGLEQAVQKSPDYTDAWSMLSLTYVEEYASGYKLISDPLERSLKAAQRATELGAANAIAYNALAKSLFFRKEFQSFRIAAERSIELNPLNGPSVASLGGMIAYSGDWERGCSLVQKAAKYHPQHPGWYWFALFYNAYRKGDYSEALGIALKINLPQFFYTHLVTAAAYGQLGDLSAATKSLNELVTLRPDFAVTAREDLGKWFDNELVEHLIEGLEKAGLQRVTMRREVALRGGAASTRSNLSNQSLRTFSSTSTQSIIVLPFTNISADEENEYFSDGLTEELISDLSKVRSLRVISRNSAMKLKGTTKDLKTIATELNVRYVLDGSVRKAGPNLRISVQLIDGLSDENLWSEKYNGTLADIFEMQENVSRSIVDALKITLSADEERQLAERPIADAEAYDLYLQARSQFLQGVPAALDRSIELLKQGLEIIGENELLYAALGYSYYVYFRWISKLDENRIRLASECMQKAFALNPSSSHGFVLKGLLSYSEGNMGEAIRSLKRALELQPNNTEALFWVAVDSSHVGDNEAAMRYADKLLMLDPLLPINTVIKGVVYVYRGEFSEALPWVEKGLALDPSSPLLIWTAAIVDAWAGRPDEAITHIDKLTQIAPDWVYTQHGLFLKHALRGEKQLALQYDSAELTKEAEHDCHFALHLAHCFALVHEHDKALDFLELAVRTGMVNYPFLNKFDPLLENIRHEERFRSLMLEAKELSENLHAK